MTEIQAALGYSQLKKIGKFLAKRRKLAMKYDLLFKNQVSVNPINQDYRKISANHLYPIQINFANANISRNELMVSLKEKGISTQMHYMPIPLHPYYEKLGYRIDNLPNALDFYFKTLSLPLYPRLSKNKQLKVVRALREILG
jgi:dTDP-4-amino-4,6-dideoxygalactose transaminase